MNTLIISDLQNDFHPLGMAAIEGSQALVPKINALMNEFELTVATQLFYPANHVIFAGNHLWRKPKQIITVNDLEIELTEMHCVANSFGAELMMGLEMEKIDKIFQKGTQRDLPAFNAFTDLKSHSTGLHEFLKKNKVSEIHFAGINYNSNLSNSKAIAQKLGYKVNIIENACLE